MNGFGLEYMSEMLIFYFKAPDVNFSIQVEDLLFLLSL